MLACYGCAYPILSFSHTHNGGALLRLKSVGISWNQHLIAFKCSVVVFPLASLCQLIITWSSIYCTYYIPSKYCMCFANSSWNSANSSWKSATSFWVQKPENRKAQIKRPTPIVRYTLREKIKRGKWKANKHIYGWFSQERKTSIYETRG